jgi:hypothetical protein
MRTNDDLRVGIGLATMIHEPDRERGRQREREGGRDGEREAEVRRKGTDRGLWPRHAPTSRRIDDGVFIETEQVTAPDALFVIGLLSNICHNLADFLANIFDDHRILSTVSQSRERTEERMDRPLETQLLQRDPSREYQTCREGEGERERRWRERRKKEGGRGGQVCERGDSRHLLTSNLLFGLIK